MSQMPEPDPPVAAVAAQPAAFGVGTALVLVFGGVILGLFGGFLQAWSVSVAGIAVPIGWVLVLATLLASIRALIHAFDKRRAGVVFFLGWVITSVLLALPTSGGDIVIAPDGLAIAYLAVGVIGGSTAANLPARLRPPTSEAQPQEQAPRVQP